MQHTPLDLAMADRRIHSAALVLKRVRLVVFFDRLEKHRVDGAGRRSRTARDVRIRLRRDCGRCHLGFTLSTSRTGLPLTFTPRYFTKACTITESVRLVSRSTSSLIFLPPIPVALVVSSEDRPPLSATRCARAVSPGLTT